MVRKHTDYRVVFHGVDNEQYFQGHGVAMTRFDDCATGIGASNAEALDDALEQLAQGGTWDVGALEEEIVARSLDGKRLEDKPEDLGEGNYYYVSIDVKG